MPNIYLQHLQVNNKKFMKVVIFNVGAALSAYVETDNKKIVIDLGKSQTFHQSMIFSFLYLKSVERRSILEISIT